MKPFASRFQIFAAALAIVLTQHGLSVGGLLPVTDSVTSSGSNFDYSYQVVLTSNSTLRSGDYFTIYDVAGLVSGSNTQPAGFVYSAPIGVTPPGTKPTDNPALANVTWTYSGATISGPATLGTFSIQSQYGASTPGQFASLTHNQVGGQPESTITATTVPTPTAPGVPEPASLALWAIALPLAGLYRYRRSLTK